MLHIRDVPYRPLQDCDISGEPTFVWLDSDGASAQGRYSFLCIRPFQTVAVRDGHVFIDDEPCPGNPFDILQSELARWRLTADHTPVPFIGGACGFIGYHVAGPPDHRRSRHAVSIPADMAMGFYDTVLGIDHKTRKSWILSSGFPETDPTARHKRAVARADELAAWLDQPHHPRPSSPSPSSSPIWQPEQTSDAYRTQIQRVLAYIAAGDIFQANLSLRFLAAPPPGFDPIAYFIQRRQTNPAPFAALVRDADLTLASFSPERFLSLDRHGHIETRPIKGSARRGTTAAEDHAARQALADSRKDRAENLMIADLMRNDLGRVAKPGSVRVPQLQQVETFPAIHHLVSVVEAVLRPGLDAIDLLRATFPGGSITGAPKIRAMDIIDELEPAQRGPYCGSIGWIGFDGAMDTSIVIRTLVATPDQLIVQAGGAIVADSVPDDEYAEVLLKAAPLLDRCP